MSNNKDYNIEELTKKHKEAQAIADVYNKQLEEAKQYEENKKKEELELQKKKRTEEIEVATKRLKELYKAYIEDYGYLKIETKVDDYDWFPLFWKHNFWF